VRASRLEKGLVRDGSSTARIGSLLTLFCRDSAPTNFREAKESNTNAFAKFFQRMRDAGVLLPPSQFEAWFLSAAHDDAVIDATIDAAAG
jgi:glutamate-1-semialdehyde 2,1-aminomutase